MNLNVKICDNIFFIIGFKKNYLYILIYEILYIIQLYMVFILKINNYY